MHSLISLGCAAWLVAAPALSAVPIKVFLLAGQSNMSGWTPTTGMPSAYTPTQPNVLIYADGELEAGKKKRWLTNGMDFGHANGWFGPELVFGKTLSDSLPGTKIALIKYATGSTYLATNWRPPSSGGTVGPMFNTLITTATSALTALDAQYTPEWCGMLWMQGEFDGGNQGYANEYQTNLGNLVKDVRSRLNQPTLPFIIAMIDSSRSWPYAGTIRTAERNVAKNTANVGIFDTYGYATDGTHYKLDGMIAMGRDYALTYLSKFRTPTTSLIGSGAGGAGRAPLRSAAKLGVGRLCNGGDCFKADGRADVRTDLRIGKGTRILPQ